MIIIGLDHRYAFEGEPNETRQMVGADPNHFSPEYFGHGQVWDNPDLARSEESYRAALAAFQADGRRVVDATLEGACPVFPKVDYTRHFAHALSLAHKAS